MFFRQSRLILRHAIPMLIAQLASMGMMVIDTVLLASAIALAVLTSQYPLAQGWLTAKVVGLVVYILCGMMALRRGRSIATRAIFFAAASCCSQNAFSRKNRFKRAERR